MFIMRTFSDYQVEYRVPPSHIRGWLHSGTKNLLWLPAKGNRMLKCTSLLLSISFQIRLNHIVYSAYHFPECLQLRDMPRFFLGLHNNTALSRAISSCFGVHIIGVFCILILEYMMNHSATKQYLVSDTTKLDQVKCRTT